LRFERWRRASLWLVPLLCAVGAWLLLRATVSAEPVLRLPADLVFDEASAVQLLAAAVSALFTLLGIVLAFTMLVVQLAMAQLSPRLVGFWYQDRHLKAALGIVVGSLVYSLLLLARVRPGFVPEVSMLVATALLLVSIGAFLSFVQHVGQTVRPDHVADRIVVVGLRMVARCLAGTEAEEGPALAVESEPRRAVRYRGRRGILQAIDSRRLVQDARRLGVRVVLLAAVGDYLGPGDRVAIAYGLPSRAAGELDLDRRLLVGLGRLPYQDVLLSLRLLVDMAIRALSPAVNDPTTAVEMLERIGRLLAAMGQRRLGGRWLTDADGEPRVFLAVPTWEDALALGVREIAEYSAGGPQVRRRLRALLHELEGELPPSRHPALERHLQALDEEPLAREAALAEDRQGFGPSRPGLS
jgi:uncharacterized membrane protein